MLKDAPVSICTLSRVVNEILADCCKVLFVQTSFFLQFFNSVSKTTSLVFARILAFHALKPKLAELSLDLVLPVFLVALASLILFGLIILFILPFLFL